MKLNIKSNTVNIGLNVDDNSVDLEKARPVYDGPYVVIPTLEDQYLDTDNKTMRQDVTVKEIPVHRVANEYGGKTVTIS